jgi:hypothetical protein
MTAKFVVHFSLIIHVAWRGAPLEMNGGTTKAVHRGPAGWWPCNRDFNLPSTSPNTVRVIKSRKIRSAGHVALMRQGTVAYRVLVGKPEGKRPLGRPRRRWEDNIKANL